MQTTSCKLALYPRWKKAHQAEIGFWDNWTKKADHRAAKAQLIKRAEIIEKKIKRYSPNPKRILQIGPAANGEIHFIKSAGKRFAIDPLAPYFIKNFKEFIDPKVNFTKGYGEKLPYPANYFDVIIILNVLDHCIDSKKVIAEINRCLKPKGIVFLGVYVYSGLAITLHKTFNFLDQEHPQTLTKKFIKINFGKHGFNFLDDKMRKQRIATNNLKKKLLLSVAKPIGLLPMDYTAIVKK